MKKVLALPFYGKLILYILAVLCALAGCYTLFAVQYWVYGNVIDTNWWLAWAIPLIIGVLYLMQPQPAEPRTPRLPSWLYKTGRVLYGILLVLLLGALAYDLFTGYNVFAAEVLLSFAAISLVGFLRQRYSLPCPGAILAIVCYLVLICTALFTPRVMRLSSVKTVQEKIEANGYENVQFVQSYPSAVAALVDEQASLRPQEAELKLYMFQGEKEGETFAFFASPQSGRIALSVEYEGQASLHYLLKK